MSERRWGLGSGVILASIVAAVLAGGVTTTSAAPDRPVTTLILDETRTVVSAPIELRFDVSACAAVRVVHRHVAGTLTYFLAPRIVDPAGGFVNLVDNLNADFSGRGSAVFELPGTVMEIGLAGSGTVSFQVYCRR